MYRLSGISPHIFTVNNFLNGHANLSICWDTFLSAATIIVVQPCVKDQGVLCGEKLLGQDRDSACLCHFGTDVEMIDQVFEGCQSVPGLAKFNLVGKDGGAVKLSVGIHQVLEDFLYGASVKTLVAVADCREICWLNGLFDQFAKRCVEG